jgi:hypothetical protein
MNENTANLIDAISRGNTMEMQAAFNQAMAEKMVVALDAFKTNVAQNLFKESEQIDEMSKTTLGSYIKKASEDKADARASAEYSSEVSDNTDNDSIRSFHKKKAAKNNLRAKKRSVGIGSAVDKLVK